MNTNGREPIFKAERMQLKNRTIALEAALRRLAMF